MGLPIQIQHTEAERNRLHAGDRRVGNAYTRFIHTHRLDPVISTFRLVSARRTVACSKCAWCEQELYMSNRRQALRWLTSLQPYRVRHKAGFRTLRRIGVR